MHELSIAEEILDTVHLMRLREGFERIHKMRLRIGAISGIDPAALDFALTSLAPGTLIDSCGIEIEVISGSGWCPRCRTRVEIDFSLSPCPVCGQHPLEEIEGTELIVQDLDVD